MAPDSAGRVRSAEIEAVNLFLRGEHLDATVAVHYLTDDQLCDLANDLDDFRNLIDSVPERGGPAMTDQPGSSGRVLTPEIMEKALDAAVRYHFEARHEAGICVPFDQIGATSRRVVRDQLRGVVTAAVTAITANEESHV